MEKTKKNTHPSLVPGRVGICDDAGPGPPPLIARCGGVAVIRRDGQVVADVALGDEEVIVAAHGEERASEMRRQEARRFLWSGAPLCARSEGCSPSKGETDRAVSQGGRVWRGERPRESAREREARPHTLLFPPFRRRVRRENGARKIKKLEKKPSAMHCSSARVPTAAESGQPSP